MFSPTATPPLSDSGSEEDDEIDFPFINLTPKKTRIEETSSCERRDHTHQAPNQLQPTTTADSTAVKIPTKTSSSSVTTSSGSHAPSAAATTVQSRDDELRERLFKAAKGEVKEMADGLSNLSPIKRGIGDKDGTVNESKKIVRKVHKLAQNLKAKNDLEKKLEAYMACNGIQGMARREEEKLQAQYSQCPEEDDNPTDVKTLMAAARNRPPTNPADPSSPSPVPDRPVFVHPPSLITELYPPGLSIIRDRGCVSGLLLEGGGEEIKRIVCSDVLPLSYFDQSCPPELSQWLFQLLGCSADSQVSARAMKNLVEFVNLSRRRGSSFHPPTVADIIGVLVTLGAERRRMCAPFCEPGSTLQSLEKGREDRSAVGPPRSNLVNLISFVSELIKNCAAEYTVQDLEELVVILCSLSLDRHCRWFLTHNLQVCIHHIIAAYPDSVWPKAQARLAALLVQLSIRHHHHQILLARLFCRTTPRELSLLRHFCRLCLLGIVKPSSANSTVNPGTVVTSGDKMNKEQVGDEGMQLDTGGQHPTPVNCQQPTISTSKTTEPNDEDMKPTTKSRNNVSTTASSKKPTDKHQVKEPSCSSSMVQSTTTTDISREPAEVAAESSGKLAKTVIEAFLKSIPKKMTERDYHKLDTILRLQILQYLEFSNHTEKGQFLRVLRALKLTIKEDPSLPITSQVKDLVIQLVLEIQGNKSGSAQNNLLLDQFFTS